MNKLPAEILNDIVIPLHQQDKVECMRVCKGWKNMVTKRYLYHTVRLCNEPAMEYLISRFQREPHLGDQVEYLIIKQFKGGYDDMNRLPCLLSLMPNLRYFYHQAWYGSYVRVQSLFQPWCKRIEHLAIHGSRSITVNLIFYNKFERLKSLYIPQKNVFDPACFSKLLQLTTLTDLHLEQCGVNLTFFHLDYMFEKLVSLESLAISHFTITYNTLPLEIAPAMALKKFHLSSIQSTDIEARVVWLQYIGKKFINVSDFQFRFKTIFLSEEKKDTMVEGYTSLFSGLKPNKFGCDSVSLPHTFFELLDNAGCQLQHLKMSGPLDIPLLQKIDSSKQAETIQTLEIKFRSLSDLNWLVSMTGLKTLVVTAQTRTRPIQINALLDLCPVTLASLKMCDVNVSVGLRGVRRPLLKSLALIKCRFYNTMDTFISTNLQQLCVLKVDDCVFKNPETKWNLSNLTLSRFEMMDSQKSPFFHLLVVTSKTRRLYTSSYHSGEVPSRVHDDEALLSPPTKSSVAGPGTHHDFMLRCASVAEVIL
jgi:hypothetical protein